MAEEKTGKKRVNYASAWAEAKGLMWAHRGTLAIGLVLVLINRIVGFVMPLSPKFLGDRVLGENRPDLLIPLALVGAVAVLFQSITSFGLAKMVSVAAQRAIATMREEVQEHVIRLPVSYFDSTKSGILISRIMNDPEGIRNLIGTGLVQLVGGVFTAIIALVILLYLHWPLTLATIGFMAVFAIVLSQAMKKLRPIFRKRGEITAEVTGRLGETLGGVRLVKTYVAEDRERKVFAEGVTRLFNNIASTITGTSAVTAISTLVVGGVTVLILIIGGRAILDGRWKITDLFTYVLVVGWMVTPLVQLASVGTQITEALAGLDRVRELRNTATEDDEDAQRAAVADLDGEVTFEHVDFEYEPGVPVLRDVSFHSPAGTTTALVGPSGSGKSTLIGLVMAFQRPTHGRVLVDGQDLAGLRLRDFRRQLGVVMQDNFLFDGTVRENITFSKPAATDEEVRTAGRIAHCDEFVSRFEKGYDTIVGERGVKLSGGQRQRVAIARAILADPRVLVLDEATSSLDSESESLIQDGLRSLRRGRTTFVIAHRLSTIQSADQILVLDDGRIVERGKHQDLLALNGLYRRLYEKQQGLVRDLFINPGEDPVPEAEDDPRATAARIAARTGQRL
ncbi:MAG TPA: ABC transporter ATP-binding protein [Longimicrobiales bacterium]